MESLQHICSRYDNPREFDAPADIWITPTDNGERLIIQNCIISISGYALSVLANIHNGVMSSHETSKWIKIGAVILLDAAALALGLFAIGEDIIRIVLGIVCLVFAVIAQLCGYEEWAKTLVLPLISGVTTFANILNAPYTAFLMTTKNGSIDPEANAKKIWNTVSCNLYQWK